LGEEADKADRDFTASIASAYRRSTRKIILSDLNKDLPRLEKVKVPVACKAAVHWVAKTIRRMTRRKALERWETRVGNCDVTPQTLWPIAKSLMKRDGPKAPAAVHEPLGITYHPNEKPNVIADCVENQFTPHGPCDENDGRRVQTWSPRSARICRSTSLGKVRPCDTHKLGNSLKLRKACGLDVIQNEYLRHLPRRRLVHLTFI
jgi:hypothetical protein